MLVGSKDLCFSSSIRLVVGLPLCGSVTKNLPAMQEAEDMDSIPGLGRTLRMKW